MNGRLNPIFIIIYHFLVCLILSSCQHVAVTFPVSFTFDYVDFNREFVLNYEDLDTWQTVVRNFTSQYNLDYDRLAGHVEEKLQQLQYRDYRPSDNGERKTSNGVDERIKTNSLKSSLQLLTYLPSQYSLVKDSNHSKPVIPPFYDLFFTNTDYHKKKFSLENTFTSLRHVLDKEVSYSSFSDPSSLTKSYISYLRHHGYVKKGSTDFISSSATAATINTPRLFIYQASVGRTGGTVALDILYETIHQLGYPVVYCDLLQPRDKIPVDCRHPRDTDIVLTGEWCHALSDFNLTTSFRGRGVQYHLGFHHSRDICRGFVTVTDSHYLSVTLENRILGGYYLGCPMTHAILQSYKELLRDVDIDVLYDKAVNVSNRKVKSCSIHEPTNSGDSYSSNDTSMSDYIDKLMWNMNNNNSTEDTESQSVDSRSGTRNVLLVTKENLIIIDPDIISDYPPSAPLTITLPTHCTNNNNNNSTTSSTTAAAIAGNNNNNSDDCRVVYAKNVPHKVMPLLLQRAKIVLDLALPGPERLADGRVYSHYHRINTTYYLRVEY